MRPVTGFGQGAIRPTRTGDGHEFNRVLIGAQRELEHAKGVVLADFAVSRHGVEPGEIAPADAGDNFAHAVGRIRPGPPPSRSHPSLGAWAGPRRRPTRSRRPTADGA